MGKTPESAGPVLVSACLLGVRCRYDGRAATVADLAEDLAGREVVLVCPEELGGLGTPRPPAVIAGGDGDDVLDGRARVVTESGLDVTARFLDGARQAVEAATRAGAREAVLKERSPSCGSTAVHGDGGVRPGRGVAAAALARAGVKLRSAG